MEMNKNYKNNGAPKTGMKLFVLLLILFPFYTNAADPLLVIRQDGKDFQDVLKGLSDELKNEFTIHDKIVGKKSEAEEISKEINEKKPKIIILMDNISISLYKKYQSSLPQGSEYIPSISLMGVMIDEAIDGLKNATGISYEIPIVTSTVSLRSVLKTPMKKIGVIHRDFLKEFMEQNKQFCKKEGIEIIDVSLPNKSDDHKKFLKESLKDLIENKKVEALWVPNDNAFLLPDIIQTVWVPAAKKYKVPVIVGVEVLVKPQLNFGTFAVLPDHVSLGSQAAEMVYDIMDNGWITDNRNVEPPLAVYKIINYPQVKKNYNISDDVLKTVDKIVK